MGTDHSPPHPIDESPIPDSEIPFWNLNYIYACRSPADPVIVWGTDVDCTELQAQLKQVNRESPVLITPVPVLLKAVAGALARYPEFNRRVLRRRIYQYRQVNLVMPIRKRRPPETDVLLLEHVDRKSVFEIAQDLWQHSQAASRGEFVNDRRGYLYRWLSRRWMLRLFQRPHLFLANNANLKATSHSKRHRTAAATVNYLGFKGAPPIRSFKPSRLPYDGCLLNVTMGAIEQRPAVVDGEVVVRSIAPLIVRADHRIVDAHDLGPFINTIRELIANPDLSQEQMVATSCARDESPSPA